MSRAAAVHEPKGESFSGLLGRLARRVSEEAGTELKSNPVRKSTLRPGASLGKQPLPQANRAETKHKATGDALPLSYERALETHRRRGKASLPALETIFSAASSTQQEPQNAHRSHEVNHEIPRGRATVAETQPAPQSTRKRSKSKKTEPAQQRPKDKRRSGLLARRKNVSVADLFHATDPSMQTQPLAGVFDGIREIQPANSLAKRERRRGSLAL